MGDFIYGAVVGIWFYQGLRFAYYGWSNGPTPRANHLRYYLRGLTIASFFWPILLVFMRFPLR